MASPLYIAQNGTYEEFLEVYDPEAHDATEMLCAGLINRDPEAREKISNDMLDRGADPTVVDYGNNTVSLLLSNEEYGESDAALLQRLIDGGADVNHRTSQGELPLRLVLFSGTDDEDCRSIYEVLFGAEDLDLELPSNVRNPINTLGGWLRLNVENRPGKLDVLDEFLKARGY